MTTFQDRRESPWLVLAVGLLMVVLLLYVAIFASSVHPGVGAAAGLAELAFAWRLTSTSQTRVFRWLLGVFGAVTIALSIVFWAA